MWPHDAFMVAPAARLARRQHPRRDRLGAGVERAEHGGRMILDLALGFAIFLAIVTGIIGSIAGLLAIAIDWLLVRHSTPTKDTK